MILLIVLPRHASSEMSPSVGDAPIPYPEECSVVSGVAEWSAGRKVGFCICKLSFQWFQGFQPRLLRRLGSPLHADEKPNAEWHLQHQALGDPLRLSTYVTRAEASICLFFFMCQLCLSSHVRYMGQPSHGMDQYCGTFPRHGHELRQERGRPCLCRETR